MTQMHLIALIIYLVSKDTKAESHKSFSHTSGIAHSEPHENLDYKMKQSLAKLSYFIDNSPLGGSLGNGSVPVYDVCTAFLKEFGKNAAEFIQCSVEKARPFRFCESCVVEFKRAMTTFEDIRQDDASKSGCRDVLLKADRIQVLDQVYNNIKAVWDQANCDGCFQKDSITEDKNGTVLFQFSDTAIEFNILFHNVTRCIRKHSNISLDGQDSLQGVNGSACDKCLGEYRELNTKFKDAMKNSDQAVCMDLVDMMNYTRIAWGLKLKCTKSHSTNAGIIIITILIAAATVAFYVVTGLRGSGKDKKIMKQKRMSHRSAAALYGTTSELSVDGFDNSEDGLTTKETYS